MKLKVSKNRKQIFQPKFLPKTEPSNLKLDLEKQIHWFVFWKKFWLENLLLKFTDFKAAQYALQFGLQVSKNDDGECCL